MRKVIAVSILSLFPLLVSDIRVSAISNKKDAMDRVVWERLVHAIAWLNQVVTIVQEILKVQLPADFKC